MDLKAQEILNEVVVTYNEILGDNLAGIYLHGSLAMGCFNGDLSDIDFLVVVKGKLDFATKRKLVETLIKLSGKGPPKGFEMSVITKRYAKSFIYPTPFEMHYSNKYKEQYIKDKNFICGNGQDPDLAAVIFLILRRGICLYGEPVNKAFGQAPDACYIKSILYDISDAPRQITQNPVYFILNLCRVLYYLNEKVVSSKYEGGKWARSLIPVQYVKIVEQALAVYGNRDRKLYCGENELIEFAEYMTAEISKIIDNNQMCHSNGQPAPKETG